MHSTHGVGIVLFPACELFRRDRVIFRKAPGDGADQGLLALRGIVGRGEGILRRTVTRCRCFNGFRLAEPFPRHVVEGAAGERDAPPGDGASGIPGQGFVEAMHRLLVVVAIDPSQPAVEPDLRTR